MRIRGLAWIIVAGLPGWPVLAQGDLLRVELVAAELRPIELDLQLSGSINATDSVQMSFRQAGRVTRVLVDEGDRVARGQELARLDSVQQDQALRVAEAGLAAAHAVRFHPERALLVIAGPLTGDAALALARSTGAAKRA